MLPSRTSHSGKANHSDLQGHKANSSPNPTNLITRGDESCPSPGKISKSAASGEIAPACAVDTPAGDNTQEVYQQSITFPRMLETQDKNAVKLLKTVNRTQNDDGKGCNVDDDVEGYNIDVEGCNGGNGVKGCSVGNDGKICSSVGDDVEGCNFGEEVKVVAARTPMLSRGERHAFTVLGLSGEFAERVLLLPTSTRRRVSVEDGSAETGCFFFVSVFQRGEWLLYIKSYTNIYG